MNPIGVHIDSYMPMIWYMTAVLIHEEYDPFKEKPSTLSYSAYSAHWEDWTARKKIMSYTIWWVWKCKMDEKRKGISESYW